LLSQIEKTIKIYDEKIVVNDKIDLQNYWKNEKEGNLSKILLLLNNNSIEYGLDEAQLEIIRNGIRFIPELILKQHEKNNHKNILHLYEKIANLVLRKIFFNYKIDSIQKIQPLSPRNLDSNKTIEILSRLFSVHDFVYNLKNQIDESIKMVNDKLFLNHSIIQLLSTIQIMEIEFDQLVRLIELEPKIFNVPLSFTSLSDKLINLLKNNKYNKTNLVKARDIVVQIENKIDTSLKNNLFEKEGK
jgi:hypothetical protein